MYVVLFSSKDLASMNIFKHILSIEKWDAVGEFKGEPVYRNQTLYLVTNDEFHIYAEGIDREICTHLGMEPRGLIVASRHKAVSGVPSLTVHPVGNFSEARYGGREGTLVLSMPGEMSYALRYLLKKAQGSEYEITFEATHHGPHVSIPTMFIEIGSCQEQWVDEMAGKLIARTILGIPSHKNSTMVLVGMGGGHYCPRHTDVVRKYNVDYGHIIPNWALKGASDEAILMAVKNTPGANAVYIHRKALKAGVRNRLLNLLAENNISVVRGDDLEKL